MAKKKSTPTKSAPEKSILNKIAGEVGYIAGSIVVGKNHLVEMVDEAIDSVKETIHSITTNKNNAPKKAVKALSKLAKPAAKKLAKPKKATPVKKAIKKVAKKVTKKK